MRCADGVPPALIDQVLATSMLMYVAAAILELRHQIVLSEIVGGGEVMVR